MKCKDDCITSFGDEMPQCKIPTSLIGYDDPCAKHHVGAASVACSCGEGQRRVKSGAGSGPTLLDHP